ncbi:MAG TPA: MCE family protein, partial [Nitrospirae bacterium]|nr:MCE family protein [Nitrospirota bacterium]
MKTELKVGLFAIIVIILLSYMTFKVSGLGVPWKKGYRLHVRFDNISGLDEKSRVKVAGVDTGVVEKVSLREGRAELTLLMDPAVRIYEDAKASLRVSGLLGDKYLAIWSGTSTEEALKDGDWIVNTEAAIDIDALANELTTATAHINDLAEAFMDIVGESERDSLKQVIYNFESLTANLDDILLENREPLRETISHLRDFSVSLKEKGPGLIDDLSTVARQLREVIEENKYALKESMENLRSASESADKIAQKLEKG